MVKKIAIIGGGNAGLVTAIGLKQMGFNVHVYEKAKKFYPVGGDIGFWPNGLKVLDKLGLYDEILEQSGRYPTIKIGTEQDEFISEVSTKAYHQIAPYDPINICRYELQHILLKKLDEHHITYDKECVSFEERSEQIFITFQDGTAIKTDLLIGADGANSTIRKYIDPRSKLKYAGYISMGGICTQPYQIKYNLIYGKYLSGAYPVSDNRHFFFFDMLHENCDLDAKYPTIKEQFSIYRNHSSAVLDEMLDKLEQSLHVNNGMNYFFVKNYYLLPLKNWSKGRVVLIGDAAQLVGAGLGCATSIILEGIDILLTSLEREKNYLTALECYQKIQQPRAKKFLKFERQYIKDTFNGNIQNYLDYHQRLITFLGDSLMVNTSKKIP